MTGSDIITGIALVLIFEGLVYALAPSLVERVLEAMRDMSLNDRRIGALICIALGVAILWLIRG